MAKHRDTAYRQVAYVNEWECDKNCPEHGPFPTEWRPAPCGNDGCVGWERYVAPYQTEYRAVKCDPPKDDGKEEK